MKSLCAIKVLIPESQIMSGSDHWATLWEHTSRASSNCASIELLGFSLMSWAKENKDMDKFSPAIESRLFEFCKLITTSSESTSIVSLREAAARSISWVVSIPFSTKNTTLFDVLLSCWLRLIVLLRDDDVDVRLFSAMIVSNSFGCRSETPVRTIQMIYSKLLSDKRVISSKLFAEHIHQIIFCDDSFKKAFSSPYETNQLLFAVETDNFFAEPLLLQHILSRLLKDEQLLTSSFDPITLEESVRQITKKLEFLSNWISVELKRSQSVGDTSVTWPQWITYDEVVFKGSSEVIISVEMHLLLLRSAQLTSNTTNNLLSIIKKSWESCSILMQQSANINPVLKHLLVKLGESLGENNSENFFPELDSFFTITSN